MVLRRLPLMSRLHRLHIPPQKDLLLQYGESMVDVSEVTRNELVGDGAGRVLDVFWAGEGIWLSPVFVWGEEREFHVDGLFVGGAV